MKLNPLIFLFILALVISYFSMGFYHPDEHFQILEYLNFLRGKVPPESLSWEYAAKMRPFIQIFFYFISGEIFRVFSDNPFYEAFIFRFITGSIGLLAIVKIIGHFDFKKSSPWMAPLLFFIPFFLFRTSSESLSSGLFLWALYFSLKERYPFWIGVLASLAVSVRLTMIIPFGILFLLKGRNFKFVIGALLSLFIATLCDYLGYGEITFTPFNYIYENIILKKSHQFGVDPWWSYFESIFIKGVPPLSLALIFATLFYWFKNPKSLFSLTTLGFFLAHLLIAHKELRFLTFIYLLSPLFLFYFYEQVRVHRSLVMIFVVLNTILFLAINLRPAYKPITIYQFIYDQKIDSLSLLPDHKGGYLDLIMPYYQRAPLFFNRLKSFDEFNGGKLLTGTYKQFTLAKDRGCEKIEGADPTIFVPMNFTNWIERSSWWAIWECK